jgi:type IV fimbrial biogenesis protein FimT
MQRGVTLIELMIGIAIVSILMTLAIPAFNTFLRNTKIKNAAETTIQGLNLARAEAVRRNASIRFQFVSDLTSGCALSTSSLAWVVSVSDPTGACDSTPGGGTAPQIVQAKSSSEGTDNVTVATTGGSTVTFNGLGRVAAGSISQIDFANPSGGACVHVDTTSGTMRCLRILVTTGGSLKICDPKVPVNTPQQDPRECQ